MGGKVPPCHEHLETVAYLVDRSERCRDQALVFSLDLRGPSAFHADLVEQRHPIIECHFILNQSTNLK